MLYFDTLMQIPKEFYAFETGTPFCECMECKKPLLDATVLYSIQKCFRKYPGYDAHDVIHEVVICMDCSQQMQEKISKESRETIQKYLEEAISRRFTHLDEVDTNQCGQCLVKGTSVTEAEEYVIYGTFQGDRVFEVFPMIALSLEAMEEINDRLSKETQDFFDEFMGKHLSLIHI